jgi:hypothetical protein
MPVVPWHPLKNKIIIITIIMIIIIIIKTPWMLSL